MARMSERIGSPSKTCDCWAPVMGTMLIMIGLFDLGFGLSLSAISIELGQIAGDIHANSGLLRIGRGVSKITGGFLNLGGEVARGEIAKGILDQLPAVWFSMLMAIGRIVLSIVSILLGIALARRMRRVIRPLRSWAWVSMAWGLIAIFGGWGLYRLLLSSSGGTATTVIFIVDFGLHVAWPVVIVRRLRLERG